MMAKLPVLPPPTQNPERSGQLLQPLPHRCTWTVPAAAESITLPSVAFVLLFQNTHFEHSGFAATSEVTAF